MTLVRKMFGNDEMHNRNALDIMYDVNPEIASLIYADGEGMISPENRPLVAGFRKLQSDEQIAFIEGMTKKYGYDTMYDMNQDSEDGKDYRAELEENGKDYRTEIMLDSADYRAELEEDGMYDRTKLMEDGMTIRQVNNGKNLLDLAKLKYDFGQKVLEDHLGTERYLSDNELKAVRFEALAQAKSIKLIHTLQSNTAKQLSKDKLEGIIQTSEIESVRLIRQAEELRGMGQDANRKDITVAYIKEQAGINRALIKAHIAEGNSNAKMVSAYYGAVKQIGSKVGTALIKSNDKKKIKIRSKGEHGNLNLDIEVE